MKLNRQKIFYGFLGVAVVAFGVDQAFFGDGPAKASAAVPHPPAPRAVVQASPSSAAAKASSSENPASAANLTLSDGYVAAQLTRLAKLNAPGGGRDAFAAPAWSAGRTAADEKREAPVESLAVSFRKAHRLEAVMAAGSGGGVIVDGAVVRVGQAVDGLRLIAVTRRSAVFAGNGETARLDLQ